jgi:hypothetical protein
MNAIELLFVLLCIGIGWAAGTLGRHHFKLFGFILAFIAGASTLPLAIRLYPKLRRRGRYWPWF